MTYGVSHTFTRKSQPVCRACYIERRRPSPHDGIQQQPDTDIETCALCGCTTESGLRLYVEPRHP